MKTTTVATPVPTDLLETLRVEEAQKTAMRDALMAERDAAKKRHDDAETALLVADNDGLPGVIKARNEARDLVDVLDVRIARAEAERQRASDRVSDEAALIARGVVAEEVTKAQATIAETTEKVGTAVHQLRGAIEKRNLAIEGANTVNEKARNYGLPLAIGAATKDVLYALAQETSIHVGVGPTAPRFVVG